jgi:uncharacterized protein YgiM (DUF1202 family)
MAEKRDYTKFSNPDVKVAEETVEFETPSVEIKVEEPEVTVEMKLGTVVGCDKLNVRETPSPYGKVITLIDKGEIVEIFDEESTATFYKICAETGVEGFCMKKFIEVK